MFRKRRYKYLNGKYSIYAILKIDAKTNQILESIFIESKESALKEFMNIKNDWSNWDDKKITNRKCPLEKSYPFHNETFLGSISKKCFLTPNNKYYYVICSDIIVYG